MSFIRDMNYCSEHQISFEQLGILKMLHFLEYPSGSVTLISNVQKSIDSYFEHVGSITLNKLSNDGFIVDYNSYNTVKLSKIKITDKFRSTYFMDIELAYEEAVAAYPKKFVVGGSVNDTMLGRHEALKNYYYDKVIDGGDKTAHERFLMLTRAMYGKNKPATVGWQTYLESFKTIASTYEEVLNKKQVTSTSRDSI